MKGMRRVQAITLVLMAVLSAPLAAQAPLAQGAQSGQAPGIAIGGEQDLPKVLYIVPWKDTDPGEPLEPPRAYLDEGVLAPVNRDAFRQQLWYQAEPAAPVVGESP